MFCDVGVGNQAQNKGSFLDFCDIQSECMKKLSNEKALFLIIGILVLLSLPRADSFAEAEGESTSAKVDDFILSGYTEVGKRSTAEDYEEEGTDDDYTYQNYHL